MRAKGEGSPRKRKDGLYEWAITVPGQRTARGNPKRISVYGKTLKEVTAKARALLKTLDAGVTPNADGLTVHEYLERWLEHKKRSVEITTFESYERIIRHEITPTLGDTRLAALTALDVERWQTRLTERRLSPRTIRYAHGLLSSALKQAVRWRLLPYNVADAVDPPRAARSSGRALQPNEARAFLDATRDDRLHALWLLAITAGLRRGELLGLRWDDVNLDAATITVRGNVVFVKGGARRKSTKTASADRTIAIDASTVAALRARFELYELERRHAGERWRSGGYVFGSTLDTPLYNSTLRRQFLRLVAATAKALGVPALERVTIHDLRRSYISLAARRGVPVKVIAERVGHRSTRVTQDIYQRTYPEMHRAAALSSDELLGDAEPSKTASAVDVRYAEGEGDGDAA